MQGVKFSCLDYRDVPIFSGDVVYADPPYANTTKYKTGEFDHAEFYEWCEATAWAGASVFVSEFTIPDRPGWINVWSIERNIYVDAATRSNRRRTDHLIEVVAEDL